MIANRDILIFADDWGRYPSTMQHIGKILCETNRVAWVGSLAHRKPTLHFADLKRIYEKIVKIFLHRKKDENITVPVVELHPFFIPFHDTAGVKVINKFLLIHQIKRFISKNRFNNFIVITTTPIIADIIGYLGEASSHYICLDDYSFFEGAFTSMVPLEKKLLQKVNTAHFVSKSLQDSKLMQRGKSFFIPQGVDVGHFVQTHPLQTQEKNQFTAVVGFFGFIAEWIDLGLIRKSALAYPNYLFLLLGKTSVDMSSLNDLSNIKYLGAVPYDELPSYAAQFSIGIIPFIINELTIAANPLKLLEYFSLGIPVVSTDLPEVAKFQEYALVAKDEEQFIKMIGEAANDIAPEKREKRRRVASQYSWAAIAENLSDIILQSESGVSDIQTKY